LGSRPNEKNEEIIRFLAILAMPTQESPLIKRMPSKAQKKQKAQKHQPLQLQLPQPTSTTN